MLSPPIFIHSLLDSHCSVNNLLKLITSFEGILGFTGYTGLYGAVKNRNQSMTLFNMWSQSSSELSCIQVSTDGPERSNTG